MSKKKNKNQAFVHTVTGSQHGWGGKGPLEVTWSNPPARSRPPRADCPGSCPDLLGKFSAFVALCEATLSQRVVMPTRACVFTSGEQLQPQHNPSGRSPVPSSLLHPQPLAAQSLTCRAWRCCRRRCGRRCRGVPWALRRRTRCAVPAGRPPAAWGVRGR